MPNRIRDEEEGEEEQKHCPPKTHIWGFVAKKMCGFPRKQMGPKKEKK